MKLQRSLGMELELRPRSNGGHSGPRTIRVKGQYYRAVYRVVCKTRRRPRFKSSGVSLIAIWRPNTWRQLSDTISCALPSVTSAIEQHINILRHVRIKARWSARESRFAIGLAMRWRQKIWNVRRWWMDGWMKKQKSDNHYTMELSYYTRRTLMNMVDVVARRVAPLFVFFLTRYALIDM